MSRRTSARQEIASGSVLRHPVVYTQDGCLQHRNIASGGSKNSLERPERLNAVNLGISAIFARLEETSASTPAGSRRNSAPKVEKGQGGHDPFTIVRSTASLVTIPEHPAARDVLHIKSEEPGDMTYAETLEMWCKESRQKIVQRQREVPPEYEGDLYLCPKSFEAFKCALGTVCEAVDAVSLASKAPPTVSLRSISTRAFVAVRPPGHHCVSGTPAGLGFVNNVIVGAVHAFYQHGYTHIVIFDIDLHHGNGTQKIVQQINEQRQESKGSARGPSMFYGSIHDIQSYPCAGGNADAIAAASLSVQGTDGQWIENIHMQPYETEDKFWTDYRKRYSMLIARATEFVQKTKAKDTQVMVLMSCGFSASTHEDPMMSKHGCYFPTSFYHRFTRDACAFADRFAQGRLVSVLEGGYSNRALISGVMAHVAGLAEVDNRLDRSAANPEWWDTPDLVEIEKLLIKRPGRKAKSETLPPWLVRTRQILECLNEQLDTDAPSPVLEIPPPEPTLKQAAAPLTLSAERSRAAPKRAVAEAKVQPAAKRMRQDPVSAATASTSTSGLSDLTPVPDTPSSSGRPSASNNVSPSISTRREGARGAANVKKKASGPSQSSPAVPTPHAQNHPPAPPASAATPDARLQAAYAELKDSLTSLNATFDSIPAAATLKGALRPIKGCVWRLAQNLADRAHFEAALQMLERLLEEAHRECEAFAREGGTEEGVAKTTLVAQCWT